MNSNHPDDVFLPRKATWQVHDFLSTHHAHCLFNTVPSAFTIGNNEVLSSQTVGAAVGTFVGLGVGTEVGVAVGAAVGVAVGAEVGVAVGKGVGDVVGNGVGATVGTGVGAAVGARVQSLHVKGHAGATAGP